jgi:hypothetical protein
MTKREEFVLNLREAADFFEQNPDVPLPSQWGGIHMQAQVETVEELRKAFHLSGPWEKEYSGETALYKKFFGEQPDNAWSKGTHLRYTLSLPREEVCVKRKVGERYVPPMPAYTPPPATGYYEPIYEWDCM